MVNILFLFPKSVDPKELDDFISNTFIPDLKKGKGLLSLKMSEGQMMSPGGPPPYSRVVEASFDSPESLMATAPAEGDPVREQMKSFGALLLSYDVNVLL